MHGRSRLVVVAIALVVLNGCWNQYAGNSGRTGQAPFENNITVANASQAVVKWQGTPGSGEPVIANGMLYGSGSSFLRAWSLGEPGPCTGVPLTCAPRWSSHVDWGATSAPVVAGDTVFIAAAGAVNWRLYAFDAYGRGDCTSQPVFGCLPKWSASWGIRDGAAFIPLLTSAEGKIFVQTFDIPTLTGDVTAFDASGVTGCGGTPKVCAPLFRMSVGRVNATLHASVDAGLLYVSTLDGISAFDANGNEGCVANVCEPLFRVAASRPGEVAVAGGRAFLTAADRLLAFDATGKLGCAGVPRVCQPLWQAVLTSRTAGESPIVTADRVFANSIISGGGLQPQGAIEAFDRAGVIGCSGTPRVCSRLFMTAPGTTYARAYAIATSGVIVVASSTVPDWNFPTPLAFRLSFFDVKGITGCSGTPKTCAPIAAVELGTDTSGSERVGRPAAGSGLIVIPRLFAAPYVVGLPD